MTTASPPPPPRPLTDRERGALTALLERGTGSAGGRPVTAEDRARWSAQVPGTLAGRRCGCGTCPSVELTDAAGRTPASGDGRVVLEASAPGALLLLFVDEDRLSYLELAPLDDAGVAEFPDAGQVRPPS
ncbi:hypothetical protein [Kineococcus sp. SYSU DK004]|uniref:hypothetical protein n=1 Tax=Kineococcus sp. SYSU DK004 TaxID=3383125 RepID=UPI003D7CA994